jgi:3-hydroxybutyryl-CoA dehydrogenase
MKNMAVIGAGTMGNGIAHSFAQSGYRVNLIDIDEIALNKALQTISKNLDRMLEKGVISNDQKTSTIKNITTYTDINKGVENTSLVVEAATEN